MKTEDFYKIYIPALEKAFQNDSINLVFYVKSPEDYLDDEVSAQIDQYSNENEDVFLEKGAYFFDAKSHNFSNMMKMGIPLSMLMNLVLSRCSGMSRIV
ncbi:hypothetical protein FW781_21640 [Chryseobacterium panacisoli]|uniref:Uncharacterized protein n=1 Tax=Chryseobacterium panacisoli TaxID=1807141 RepID=A0A5D8ZE32_9FLAO|nr:hypothetical protein [Chryseobacterium panacisoli]TZF92343.1 hypothetical protein FW781_21640 [Chryseobacterium panacisoli]